MSKEHPFTIKTAPSDENLERSQQQPEESILRGIVRQAEVEQSCIAQIRLILGEEKTQELTQLLDTLSKGAAERGEGFNPEDLENLQQWIEPVLSDIPEAKTQLGMLLDAVGGIDIDHITEQITE